MHIAQSERVTIGLDGKLYFANLVRSDSREDYICHAQYREARTILPATAVSLSVKSSERTHNAQCTQSVKYRDKKKSESEHHAVLCVCGP